MNQKLKNMLVGLAGVAAVAAADAALAQEFKKIEGTIGYAIDQRGWVVRNPFNMCWRTGYWTPAMAIAECDPDLVKKPEAAKPAPAPAPEKKAPEKVTFSADALFDFDKAVLRPLGQKKLDEFAGKLKDIKFEVIVAVGHADRIGSEAYNKKLSLRRAEAVKAYLVSKGIAANQVYVDGKGESDPVTKGKCKGEKATKALIDCLQPDRRVDVEVAGTRK